MSGADAIDGAALRAALVAVAARLEAARDELCRLDAIAGDGDLGATLAAGFGSVAGTLAEAPAELAPGALLRRAGLELAERAPSTSGTLIAGALLAGGREVAGRPALDAGDLARVLRAAADSVGQRGGAAVGERTMLDAMVPAADAAERAAADGADPRTALGRATAAAEIGAAATAAMEPVHGRAGWIPDRARGSQDAGAAAWAIVLDGIVAGLDPASRNDERTPTP